MLLKESERYNWFNYPNSLLTLTDKGLLDFDPWVILTNDSLINRYKGLKNRYPNRELVPFARREDNDDVACFEGSNDKIVIIHDYASEGYESSSGPMSFWDWFRLVIEVFIEYNED